jgi:hypothetical protein
MSMIQNLYLSHSATPTQKNVKTIVYFHHYIVYKSTITYMAMVQNLKVISNKLKADDL